MGNKEAAQKDPPGPTTEASKLLPPRDNEEKPKPVSQASTEYELVHPTTIEVKPSSPPGSQLSISESADIGKTHETHSELIQSLPIEESLKDSCWNFSSQHLTAIYVAYKFHSNYCMRLFIGSEPFELQGSAINENEIKAKIWSRLLPKSELQTKLAIEMIVNPSATNCQTYWSPIVPIHGYSHQFVFQLIFFSNPPGQFPRLASAFLLYFVEIITKPNFERIFPQLFLQACSSGLIFKTADANIVSQLIETILSRKSVTMELAGCLFAILGLFEEYIDAVTPRSSTLLQYLNEEFLRNLSQYQEGTFRVAVMKGISLAIYRSMDKDIDLSLRSLQLCCVQSSLAADFEHFIIQNIKHTKHCHLSDFMRVLPVLSKQFQFEYMRERLTLPSVRSYTDVFQLFHTIKSVYSSIEELGDAMRTVLMNFEHGKRSIAESEVIDVLDMMKNQTDTVKVFVYRSRIPYFIGKWLSEPNMKSIQTYSRLLQREFDEKLLAEVNFDTFYTKLIENAAFSRIISETCPNESYYECIIKAWKPTLCSFSYYNLAAYFKSDMKISIDKIDTEFQKIVHLELRKKLAPLCINLIFEVLTEKSLTAHDILEFMIEIKSSDIQEAFVDHVISRKMVGDEPGQIDFYSLNSGRGKHKDSLVFKRLFEVAEQIARPPSYHEVETSLIKHEEFDEKWKAMLENLNASRLKKALVEEITRFGANIANRTISIEKLLEIRKKTPDQQLSLQCTVALAFSHANPAHAQLFKDNLSRAFDELDAIQSHLENLTTFLTKIVPDLVEHTELELQLKSLKENYRSTLLSSFVFPEVLEQLLPIAINTVSYQRSGIFKDYLQSAKAGTTVTVSTVADVCTRALDMMFQFLESRIPTINTASMVEIATTFSKFDDWKKEITIISAGKKWAAELNVLRNCLEMYFSRESLIETGKLTLNMLGVLNITEEQFRQTIQKHISALNNLEGLTVANYMDLYKNVTNAIYPEKEKMQGETALAVLAELQKSPTLLEYLSELTAEKLKYSLECVNDYESTVTPQLIRDLENVWIFFGTLKQECKTYEHVISLIRSQLAEAKFSGIIELIRRCHQNLPAFKEQSANQEKKEETKRRQMELIHHSSQFFIVKTTDGYDISLNYEGNTKGELDIAVLIELKERASLTLHSSKNLYDQSSALLLESFIVFVVSIRDLLETLKLLNSEGYPEDLAVGEQFACIEGEFASLVECCKKCRDTYQSWSDSLETAYAKSHYLTFLSGSQLWKAEHYLLTGEDEFKEAASLFLYLGKRAVKADKVVAGPKTPSDRLTNLARMLAQLPNAISPDLKIDYTVPVQSKITDYKGNVIYASVRSTDFLKAVLSVHLHTEGRVPKAHQVLFCARSTSWAELQAYVYRCFTSKSGEVYTLVGCERLSLDLQTKFRSLFAKVYQKRVGSGIFALAVITANDDSLLSEYFRFLEDPATIQLRSGQIINEIGRIIKQIDSRRIGSDYSSTIVVESYNAGVGKSTWIHQQADELGKPIESFPISGDLNMAELCQRLLAKATALNCLHIVLNHVENMELLEDVLTFLITFRTLSAGQLLAVIPPTCQLFIEVANLHLNLASRLPILTYLTRHLVSFEIENLTISPQARFVAAYLQCYDSDTLNRDDISSLQIPDIIAKEMLIKYFIEPTYERGQEVTYTSFNTFVKCMYVLINNVENGPLSFRCVQDMMADCLQEQNAILLEEYSRVRNTVLRGLIDTTEEVTKRCAKQVKVQSMLHGDEVMLECTLNWGQSNHFSMVFNEDGSHVAIYRMSAHVPKPIQAMLFIQKLIQKLRYGLAFQTLSPSDIKIDDYTKMSHEKLLKKFKTYVKGRDIVAELQNSDYILTPDNFLKMNLIYLRAIIEIPIVIMGETGCGKTSLVKFFVSKVLQEALLVFNIHAGITSKHVAAYVKTIFDTEAKREKDVQIFNEYETQRQTEESRLVETEKTLPKEEQTRLRNERSKQRSEGPKHPGNRIWVFFDEFNTSECVGEFSEILCERTYKGKPLPKNIVFIAACNPYRLRSASLIADDVGIKKSDKYQNRASMLMHVVKPLPESVLEYVWDFGSLTVTDSKKYILTMLSTLKCGQVELFADLVWMAHEYFQKNEDVSSVSLRDVMRFAIFYKWFQTSLSERKRHTGSVKYRENCQKYNLMIDWNVCENEELTAGIMALCNCYYFRLSDKEARKQFLLAITARSHSKFTLTDVYKELELNENDIIARMDLPNATALNRAFRENLACMVNCIFSRVPLFICGKPGCSKSLAIQLVFSNLRGDKSEDSYFRTLPELVMVPFQGSESCTSEGIEQVFDRAAKFTNSGLSILPVVVFDEIGLAEISEHNPLKVLHSLLELERRDIGFVGVSNWRLDASKMNRAMYLARPDPDLDELIFTAKSIYLACKKQTTNDQRLELIENLAKTYHSYKEALKGTKYVEFYGLRDFYSLIKQTSTQILKYDMYLPSEQIKVAKRAIERNFGGTIGASACMMSSLVEIHRDFEMYHLGIPEISTVELIRENLTDSNARFLMLLCKGDVATYAVEKYIQSTERCTLMGSRMEDDVNGEEYGFRSLSDIILYMEKGVSMILKGMDHIYTSLYDLFNQNYTRVEGRRYCRVALGAQFNPRCFVHEHFHVIVFVNDDDDTLEQTDAPFLNRFEKHSFAIELLFDTHQQSAFSTLKDWLEKLKRLSSGKPVELPLNYIFPLYSEEYLKLLVLFVETSSDKLIEKCKLELLQMASEEVMLIAHASGLSQQEKEFIESSWRNLHKDKFADYVSQLCHSSYTSDKSLVFVFDKELLQTDSLREFSTKLTTQHFSVFKSQRQLVQDITNFYKDPNKLVYMLLFSLSKDSIHLALVKFTFEQMSKEFSAEKKHLCLLVPILRNEDIDIDVCWFENWSVHSFSSFNQTEFQINTSLLSMQLSQLFESERFSCFDRVVSKMTLEACRRLVFLQEKLRGCLCFAAEDAFIATHDEISKAIFFLVDNITLDSNLIFALKRKVLFLMQSSKRSWVEEVLCNPNCITQSTTLQSAITIAVETEVLDLFTQVFFAIEKFSAFRSYFTPSSHQSFLQTVWLRVLDGLPCADSVSRQHQSNQVDFSVLLTFPFIMKEKETIDHMFSIFDIQTDKIEDQFSQKFHEQSILGDCIDKFGALPDLQETYIRELILLDLTEREEFYDTRNVLLSLQLN